MMEFSEVVRRLESGEIRVAEKTPNGWKVNAWVKEAILEGFRQGRLIDMSKEEYSFFDKDTLPLRKFSLEDKVRIVPGGNGRFTRNHRILRPGGQARPCIRRHTDRRCA